MKSKLKTSDSTVQSDFCVYHRVMLQSRWSYGQFQKYALVTVTCLKVQNKQMYNVALAGLVRMAAVGN